MDTCTWSWDLGFAVSSLSLASLLSGLFPEAQPIYLLTRSLIQDPLIYKPAAQKGMPLLHKYTERDREKENDNVILTHSLSFWEVGHPPRIQSTITNKSFSYCFSDQIWSPNNRLFSSTFCTSKWRRESPEETEREWEREAGIHLLHRSTLSGPVNVLCDQATGTGRLGPHDLITPLTKSPELSLREIREARPQGPGRTRQPQNISGTLHLCWPTSL